MQAQQQAQLTANFTACDTTQQQTDHAANFNTHRVPFKSADNTAERTAAGKSHEHPHKSAQQRALIAADGPTVEPALRAAVHSNLTPTVSDAVKSAQH